MADQKDLSFLGRRMKELREKHNCTMDDMVVKLNEIGYFIGNKSSVSRAESGKTGERTLMEIAGKYCDVFGMNESQKSQFLRGIKIAIPDTSALLRNAQLIDELNKEYSKVVIPKVVVDELDYIKNHHRNQSIAKKAWEILRGISYGEKTELIEYGGPSEGVNNDNKIIWIARSASERYSSKDDISTDYSVYLKGDESITALHLRDYMKKKQILLDMDRMKKFDAMYLESYEGVEKPTIDEANGYLQNGNTLIISAVRNTGIELWKRKKKIKWLIECGADINQRDCSRRYIPALTHAIQLRDFQMFIFLLKDCNANPNIGSRNPHDSGNVRQKNEGNMPLMVAAWHGQEAIVKALCSDERTSINQQDANGFTALMKACMRGKVGCKDALLKANADQKIVDINGMTAKDHYNVFFEKGPAENPFFDDDKKNNETS